MSSTSYFMTSMIYIYIYIFIMSTRDRRIKTPQITTGNLFECYRLYGHAILFSFDWIK